MNVRSVLPKDAIPSIDEPVFDDEYFGDPDDEVIVVEADPAKAYPIRILNYHEIVNDRVDDEAIAVTWCPLCGSAIVYDSTVDGRPLTFGVSGKLADDDLVMYDRETDSEWKQSLGECIAGPLEGASLTVRPASQLTYRRFRDAYPDGVVLQPTGTESEAASDTDEPAPIDYDQRPYAAYVEGDGFGLDAHRGDHSSRDWHREDIDPKTVVLGIEHDGEAVGFPLPAVLDAGGLVETTVGGRDVIVIATDEGIHAFDHPGWSMTVDGSTVTGDGVEWDLATGEGTDGRRLTRVPAKRVFAFTWYDDHGDGAFYLPSP